MSAFSHGTITVACPNCGADDYEFELEDVDDLDAHLSVQCEECDKRVEVVVNVWVQAVAS